MPAFRSTYEDWMHQMSDMSMFFMSLIAESLELPPDAFDNFFEKPDTIRIVLSELHARGHQILECRCQWG